MKTGMWVKSSRSNGAANCVEVRPNADGTVSVRDTKDEGNGPEHTFTQGEWEAFVAGVRDGEFDL